MVYSATTKGRAVLRSAALWGLSGHLRDLLALSNPQVSMQQARQFMPRHSLHAALYSLQQLELIEGPPTPPPKQPDWAVRSGPGRERPEAEAQDSAATVPR